MSLLDPKIADFLDPHPTMHPVRWTQDKRGGFLWSKQREVAQSVVDNRFTAVQSCHGTGKSWLAGDLVAWWMDEHPIGEAFAVTTAPTAPQVEAILWREISVAKEEASIPGRITWGQVPTWKMGDRMIAYGRKPADYADPNKAMQAFQGIHARFVLVVLDEACGIPVWLWNAVDTLVTNDNSRVLAIGNPDDPSAEFEKKCRPGSGWNRIKISAFDLPWATGETVPARLAEELTGAAWVEERKKRWGEGSPLYQSKVLGEFPDISDDSLIPPKLVRIATEKDLSDNILGVPGVMGGDVARLGVDKTVAYHNIDGYIRKVGEWFKQNTMRTAGCFKNALNQHNNLVPMWIDVSGLGAGPFDRLREQHMNVHPFDGGSKPVLDDDPTRPGFYNLRAEQYWLLREDFENELVDLDELDEDLAGQLVSIKWKVNSRGKVIVESKDDMRKRGLPSPDHADAVMMSRRRAIYVPDFDEDEVVHGITDDLLGRKM